MPRSMADRCKVLRRLLGALMEVGVEEDMVAVP